MFKICDDSFAFGHTCPANHTACKVWRAPPFGFDEPVRGPSKGGSAMHMMLPDGIGREAGIGRTQNRNELKIFRAYP